MAAKVPEFGHEDYREGHARDRQQPPSPAGIGHFGIVAAPAVLTL